MRVLIVEDEIRLNNIIKKGFVYTLLTGVGYDLDEINSCVSRT